MIFMNLIERIKSLFSKKKNDSSKISCNKSYWFPAIDSPDPILRKVKINKIYKKDRSIDTSNIYHIHYNFVNHPVKKKFIVKVGDVSGSYSIAFGSNNIVSGYNNIAYGYSSFPININKVRIKKLNKIYGRTHEV